jgi:hypothetical protein
LSLGEQLRRLRQLQILPAISLLFGSILRLRRSYIYRVFHSILECKTKSLSTTIIIKVNFKANLIHFLKEIQKFQASRFNLLFLFFIATMFGLSIVSLLVYHIYLAAKNRTTLGITNNQKKL